MINKLRSILARRSGTVAGWYQQGCSAVAALVSVPILIKHLGVDVAGIWLAFQSIAAVASLTDFGFGYVTSRETAFAMGKAQSEGRTDAADPRLWQGVARTLAAARRLNFISVMIGVVVLIGVGIYLPNNEKFKIVPVSELVVTWFLLGGSILITLSAKPAFAVLEGSGSLAITRVVSGTQLVLTSLGAALAAVLGHGLTVMAAVACGLSVWAALVFWFLVRKMPGLSTVTHVNPTRYELKKMIRLALPIGVVSVGSYCFSAVQTPLIAAMLSPALVAPFYLLQRLGLFMNMAIFQFLLPELPRFSRLYSSGNKAEAVIVLDKTVTTVVVLTIVGMVGFFLSAQYILSFVFHVKPPSAFVVGVMAVDYLLVNCTVCWAQFVLASGRNPFAVSSIFTGIANFVLLYFIILKLGLVAVPLATLISSILFFHWVNLLWGLRLRRELLN